MIDIINGLNTTWKAGRNFGPATTRKFLRRLCGIHKDNHKFQLGESWQNVEPNLPENFDARKNWPNCKRIGKKFVIKAIVDPAGLFGAVGAMSDRLCIASNGHYQNDVSAQDLLTCGDSGGCNGGYPSLAWTYWESNGLVTGGLYGSNDGCRPYSIKPCEHHMKGKRPPCSGEQDTPQCVEMCDKSYNGSYSSDKSYAKDVYSVPNNMEQIMTEIYRHGPVEGAFRVYADFLNYKSGVYKQHSKDHIGDHAIKILGWGVENGLPYWLVANSWNSDWGDNGYFKILRGTDECRIERYINAGLPKI
ncbi:CTSB [Cordylochernes scorpioides]|uniref:CTSB n=1 Tax=Cordylochernes scorpioides TaxID=51811 RepID=A0ABY6L1J5_9ARAC|nr:CTSB [Cordylochernes scorpioides]